jgi:NAD(P)-dependent dehydrogenase (short-subunit alcohol dehydrogenase family)
MAKALDDWRLPRADDAWGNDGGANRKDSPRHRRRARHRACHRRASYVTGQVLCVDGGFDSTGIGLPTLRAQMRNA